MEEEFEKARQELHVSMKICQQDYDNEENYQKFLECLRIFADYMSMKKMEEML